jgi:cardiolipin synthase A/B
MKQFDNLKGYTNGNKIKLVKSGADYFITLENIINEAKESIHFQTYIYDEDTTGKRIADLLIKATQRGVKVYLLIDAYASGKLSERFTQELLSKGIEIRRFSPLHFWRLETGRRLHHKITVIDKKYALIGGINISDKYHGITTKEWLDYAVLIQGNLVWDSYLLCYQLWNRKLNKPRLRKTDDVIAHSKNMKAQLVQHDFFRRKMHISKSYERAIKNAEYEIIMATSYFLPNRKILSLLKKAADRGVKIKLVLSHQSDVPISQRATQYLYKQLFRHHIAIFEYKASIIHAKVMAVDNEWSTVGSYNLNFISEYNSIELNVDIADVEFTNCLKQELETIIKNDCVEITAKNFSIKSGFFTQIVNRINYTIVRLLFRILFLLTKKDKTYDII